MKNKIIMVLLLIFVVTNTKHVEAAYSFQKLPNNPQNLVLLPNYQGLLQSHITYLEDTYIGLFSNKSLNSKHTITLGASEDGQNWNIHKEVETSSNNLYAPRSIKINNSNFRLYYTKEENVLKIYSRNCDLDFNCSEETLDISPTVNNWDSDSVGGGFPFIKDSITYMFYEGLGPTGWNIGLAFKNNIGWNKCATKVVNGGDPGGSFLHFDNGIYFLFFHSSKGIEVIETTEELGCNTKWTNRRTILSRDQWYDQNHMIAPSLVEKEGKLYLYYTGLGNDGVWRLNLATADTVATDPSPSLIHTPSPTLTVSPTTTPSPPFTITPSPTPVLLEKSPVILIPGMFGSWNKEAILHNKEVSIYEWQLMPFTKEYDGIIKSLINIGYIQNHDLYIFPYDWRKPISESSHDLHKFIENKTANHIKVNLIGHSLGGLVGRIYAQNYEDKVKKLITIGTPHKGVVQVYEPLSAGVIERENNLLWLAQKVILAINKTSIEFDRVTIAKRFPVLFDLLPTFDFLKSNSRYITYSSMHLKNFTIPVFDQTFNMIYPLFTAIYGDKNFNTTPISYIVEKPNFMDNLLGNYQDGKPVKTLSTQGDYTVTTLSANQDNDSTRLPFDHSEIITEKDSVKTILTQLQIPYQNNQIENGKKTTITPSLLFLIQSPAHMEVVTPSNEIIEEIEGMIYIDNAKNGNYSLRIIGDDLGSYTVHIGQIGSKDRWDTIQGAITSPNPTSEIDEYKLSIDLQKPHYPVENNLQGLEELIRYLLGKNSPSRHFLSKTINQLEQTVKSVSKNSKKDILKNILESHDLLFKTYDKKEIDFETFITALEKIEIVFEHLSISISENKHVLKTKYFMLLTSCKTYENIFLIKKMFKKINKLDVFVFKQINDRLISLEKAIEENNTNKAFILIQSTQSLIRFLN